MVFVCKVKDVFHISGRGVVIVLDRDTWVPEVKIRPNNKVLFRAPDGSELDTTIVGIEFLRGLKGGHYTGILLPADIKKNQVTAGAEIWLIQD